MNGKEGRPYAPASDSPGDEVAEDPILPDDILSTRLKGLKFLSLYIHPSVFDYERHHHSPYE